MKNILNFFLSVIGGYIICLVLYLVFLMILLNFWTPPSSHFLMFFLSSLSFYTLSLLFFVCFVAWGLFSFLLYKFFNRILLKLLFRFILFLNSVYCFFVIYSTSRPSCFIASESSVPFRIIYRMV